MEEALQGLLNVRILHLYRCQGVLDTMQALCVIRLINRPTLVLVPPIMLNLLAAVFDLGQPKSRG